MSRTRPRSRHQTIRGALEQNQYYLARLEREDARKGRDAQGLYSLDEHTARIRVTVEALTALFAAENEGRS